MTQTPHAPTGHPSTPPPIGKPQVDRTRPQPARRYDYWLGGKDNFAADRASGDRIAEAFPTIRTAVIENRRFLVRVVRHIAARGIHQFLDIGTGLPTSPNVHEVAQAIAPACRIVYVDNDPMVVAHARARMTSTPEGVTAYLHADLRNPETILTHPQLRATLNLNQPVAVLLVAVLHFIDDNDAPYDIVARLVQALPSGSYLAISHFTLDPLPDTTIDQLRPMIGRSPQHGVFQPRDRAQVTRLTNGLTLIPPGLVPIVDWQPHSEPVPQASIEETAVYGVVARVP
jgi:hypothetical protein